MHNMLGNWDVDNDPAVSDAGERASRMLFSSANNNNNNNVSADQCQGVSRPRC